MLIFISGFREQEGSLEDMYAPIQKKKKPAIEVDMVDNDLYGSTDDWLAQLCKHFLGYDK